MKKFRVFSVLFCIWVPMLLSQESTGYVRGKIEDKKTRNAIPFVNVKVLSAKWGCVGSADGTFFLELPRGDFQLRFSAIGYEAELRSIHLSESDTVVLTVLMEAKDIVIGEEVVIASRSLPERRITSYDRNLTTIDDVTSKVEGVSLTRRANFASEPSIRGMGPGRIGMMVDGMKVFSACVDHMDPVSAYVETENLKKLEISKGGFDQELSQNIGGTVNMVTEKPDFEKRFAAESEAGYEAVSRLGRVRSMINIAGEDLAVRGTFSYRRSGDYRMGGNDRVRGSGFNKNNYKLDATQKWGDQYRLNLSYIGDNAWDIGYPTMLMDARKTHSHIGSIEFIWEKVTPILHSLSSKIYVNRIEHWMDDYDRDVASREIMKDMYMPMFGKTTTAGIMEQALFLRSGQALRLTAEYYHLDAFADMRMESILPGVSPMYVVNIGQVGLNNLSLAAAYDRSLFEDLTVKLQARMDYSNRDIHDPSAKRVMYGMWQDQPLRRTYFTSGISLTAEYRIGTHVELSALIGRSERMPTHLENYGFYLYNIQDGHFYIGNPRLRPERSHQIEGRFLYHDEKLQFRTQWYHTRIYKYIMGLPKDDNLRTYGHVSMATIIGMESHAVIILSPVWTFSASAAYAHGDNEELNEPLPMMPAFETKAALIFEKNRLSFGVEHRRVAAQRRIARIAEPENRTKGFGLWHVRTAVEINEHLEWKFGVENIFDKLYHEHQSVGDLPGRGRNVYTSLVLSY